MLHRYLFVAGMTVGVMAPLVWAAYVARPASHAERTPTVTRAEAIPEAQQPRPPAADDATASIPPAPIAAPAPAKTARPRSRTVAAAYRPEDRTLPAVVDTYNGAHIITVCAALTIDEQLRAGCP